MSRLLELLRATIKREQEWAQTRVDDTQPMQAAVAGEDPTDTEDLLATIALHRAEPPDTGRGTE